MAQTILGGGVTHSLTNEGHDASEDGTGRGTPIVAYLGEGAMAFHASQDPISGAVAPAQGANAVIGVMVTPLAIRGREHGAEIGPEGGPQGSLRSAGGGGSLHSLVSITSSDTPQATDLYDGAIDGEVTHSIRVGNGNAMGGVPSLTEGTVVRRLTPIECERLQGYDDNWTDGQADSARYRQLGNSVAVPCVEWIARRLITIDNKQEGETK